MGKKKQGTEAETLKDWVVLGMQEKKARDIVVLDLRQLKGAVADFFIVATGTSDAHIDAISGSIEEMVLKNTGTKPWQSEGRQQKEWILTDFVDVVSHVFLPQARERYRLDELWGDAQIEKIKNLD